MSMSVTDQQYKKAAFLINKVAEPAIRKIVDALNSELKKHGVIAGCELKWFFDKTPEPKEKQT